MEKKKNTEMHMEKVPKKKKKMKIWKNYQQKKISKKNIVVNYNNKEEKVEEPQLVLKHMEHLIKKEILNQKLLTKHKIKKKELKQDYYNHLFFQH